MESKFKVWYITGSAAGLGPTLISKLLAAGHYVAAASGTFADLEVKVGEEHQNFLPLKVNFSDEASVLASFDETLKVFGRIDVVVNNSGYTANPTTHIINDRQSLINFETSLLNTVNITRNIMPYFRRQRSGRIIQLENHNNSYQYPASGFSTQPAIGAFMAAVANQAKAFHIYITTVAAPGKQETNKFITDLIYTGTSRKPDMSTSYCN